MELTKKEAQSIASGLKLPAKAFIDGRFCDASDGAVFETINPATVVSDCPCGPLFCDRC